MKGLLYFAQNSAFQHLTKIGKTTKLDVEDRGLSGSNVPEDFDYLAVLQCDNVDWAEKKVHEQFSGFRHFSQKGRKTEFFWSGCIKNAIKYALDLKGVQDTTKEETEEIEVVTESGEKQKQRTPNTTFEMIGLNIGTQIYFENNKSIIAIVKDTKNKVEFNGRILSVSKLSDTLVQKKRGREKVSTSGFWHFYYNDKRLFELRPDQQEK